MSPLLLVSFAAGGDASPLCQAVAQADAVVEVGFSGGGEYPAAHRRKRWEPPPEEIEKTVGSGRVLAVWKGDPSLLAAAPRVAWMGFSNQSPSWWDRFFSGQPFAALAVLRRDGDAWASAGVVESLGACHASWCWDDLRADVAACLAAEGLAMGAPADLAPLGPGRAPPEPKRGWLSGCAGS